MIAVLAKTIGANTGILVFTKSKKDEEAIKLFKSKIKNYRRK